MVPKSHKNELSSAITPATGAKRITDRFVKYPYPPNVASVYQKEIARAHKDFNAPPPKHKDAFNLEKEPKSHVKHKFTGNSSFLMDFTKPPQKAGRSEQPQSSEYNSNIAVKQRELKGAPTTEKASLYKNEFQNWGGVQKPLVEKTP